MKTTIRGLEEFGWFNNYLQYVQFRQSGLKEKAQASLNVFLKDFQAQSKQAKWQFIDFVHRLAFTTKDYSTYLPTI
jgi:hypothetical protein